MQEAFQHILVGIDFSPSSKAALEEAIRIARRADARLTIFHIVDGELVEHMRAQAKFTDQEVLALARTRLRECIDPVIGCGLDWHEDVLIGHPFEEIAREVGRHAADLVVLGAGGTADNGGHIGVFAKRCVRKLPAEVLLVRLRVDECFGKVLQCVDFSETSKRALEVAAQVAYADRADLHLLHVCSPPVAGFSAVATHEGLQLFETSPPEGESGSSHTDALLNALNALVEERIGDRYPGMEIECSVEIARSAGHGIFEFLENNDFDLVVVGTRGRTRLRSLLLGTVAEKVINRSSCSVLAVKPENFRFEL